MKQNEALLSAELKKTGVILPSLVTNKLLDFLQLLLEANKKINLTAITGFEEALIKHIYDSLIILAHPEYQKAQIILDIGSGAGIPSIPLAISSPEKQIFSLDATQKKIKFQEEARQALDLNNLYPFWGRAEDFIRTPGKRECFDLVLARAVAPVNILAELTLPYVRINGLALFYKGIDCQREIQAGANAISTMGGSLERIFNCELPLGFGGRSLVYIRKHKATPLIFPRKAGLPEKKPL